MNRKTLCTALLLALAPCAQAQMTVIGGGLARDCFEAAKFSMARFDDAERLCTLALEQEALTVADRAATLTNRGVLRMREGKLDAALSDYAASKRMKPEAGATWLNEGAAHILARDYAAALTALDRAILLAPEEVYAAYYNRALAREKTGDIEGAYSDFLKSSELRPDFEPSRQQLSRFVVTTP